MSENFCVEEERDKNCKCRKLISQNIVQRSKRETPSLPNDLVATEALNFASEIRLEGIQLGSQPTSSPC